MPKYLAKRGFVEMLSLIHIYQVVAMREEQIAYQSSAEHILERLLACGLKQKFAPAVLAAAAELLEPPASREWVIAEVRCV